jgi:hypothetical protein
MAYAVEDAMTPIGRMLFASTILVAALSALPGIALAQNAPGVPQAPVGHRQPTANDVPADDSVKGVVGKAPAAGGGLPPQLDVKATCRRAQPLSGGQGDAYQGCLNDETAAQKELVRLWSTFKAGSQVTCAQETKIGGAPSYVELLTCLQLDQQAAEAARENKN